MTEKATYEELEQRVMELEKAEIVTKEAKDTVQKAPDKLEPAVEKRTAELKKINSELKLEIAKRKQAERVIKVKTYLRNRNVVIEVADNGSGVSEEDLEYIFDPFFTRKEIVGVGVGLSVCQDIVKNHGGTIMAGSAPECGAVLTVELPCLT